MVLTSLLAGLLAGLLAEASLGCRVQSTSTGWDRTRGTLGTGRDQGLRELQALFASSPQGRERGEFIRASVCCEDAGDARSWGREGEEMKDGPLVWLQCFKLSHVPV